jgi:putative acetyltransferase
VLKIAAVAPGDAAALNEFRGLLVAYQENLPVDLRVPDLETELRTLPERYAAPAGALLIAYDGTDAIGCVAVKALDGRTAEIKRLYVVPSARRAGAGRALMEAAITFAREGGYARVVLDTQADHLAGAYRLYLSLGFVACDQYGPAEYANPTFMELVLERFAF